MTTSPREPCPEARLFTGLLEGLLPPETEEQLTRHLDNCGACRQRLDSLNASGEFTARIKERLGNAAPPSSHLTSVLVSLENTIPSITTSVSRDGATAESSADSFDDVLSQLEPPRAPSSIGRVAHYDLLEFLGRGGMGVVFKARDTELDRFVAVKFLSPSFAADERACERFLREARAIAAINHPNIVTIHAVDSSGPLPFLVMEYVAGESLQHRLDRSGRLNGKQTARVGFQVATGLHAAHSQGIIHRDIKPANILIDGKTRRVKLTDFGLARSAGDSSLTETGLLVGTPAFLAPEVVEEKPVDHRTDLFSLGSVLYTTCTGRPPIERTTVVGMLQQIAACRITPASETCEDVPVWLSEVIGRLHAHEPGERYQSAAELARDLKRQVATRSPAGPKSHGPVSSVNRIADAIRRVSVVNVVIAVCVVMIAAIAGKVLHWGPATAPSDDPTAATHVSMDEAHSQRVLSDEALNGRDADVPIRFGPFLLKNADEESFQIFDTLANALDEADESALIRIHGNGPFETAALELGGRRIAIEAAPGSEPQIVFRPDRDFDDDESQALLRCEGALLLKGLSLEVADRNSDNGPVSLVVAECESLHIANCRFVGGENTICVDIEHADVCHIVNSEFFSPRGRAIVWTSDAGGGLNCDNCILFASLPLGVELVEDSPTVELYNCTVVGTSCFQFLYEPEEFRSLRPLQFVVEQSVFAASESFIRLESDPPIDREDFAESLQWDGERNAWHEGPQLVSMGELDDENQPGWLPQTIDQFEATQDFEERDSVYGPIRLQSAWPSLFEALESEAVPSRDMLTLLHIPGRDEDADDEDSPGANHETIGPGPGYRRWMQQDRAHSDWPEDDPEDE